MISILKHINCRSISIVIKHMSLTVIHPSLRDVSAPDDLHIQNLTRSVFHLQGIQKERIHHLSLCLILIVSQNALNLLHLHR